MANEKMQEYYYHYCPVLLGEGSVVKVGNYGRLVIPPSSAHHLREIILEEIRLKNFPQKPSRYSCIFLLKSKEEAIQYVKTAYFLKHTYNDGILYKVKIIENNLPMHTGCTGILGLYNKGVSMEDVAIKYWKGEYAILKNENGEQENFAQEILTASSIEIVQAVPL